MTPQSPSRIRVVILENAFLDRRQLEQLIGGEQDMELLLITDEPDVLLACVEQHHPEVALIDLRLKGDCGVGIQALRDVKARSPGTRCLVLTALPTVDNFLACLRAGADGFISKESEDDIPLQHHVRRVARDLKAYDPALVERVLKYTELPDPAVLIAPARPLTAREMDVLKLLADGLTNKEIARRLSVSPHTVKAQIHSLQSKLDARDRRDAVLKARLNGLI